jgi:hypothetical protein
MRLEVKLADQTSAFDVERLVGRRSLRVWPGNSGRLRLQSDYSYRRQVPRWARLAFTLDAAGHAAGETRRCLAELGARERDIQRQFFAEALTLTLAGGLLGIAAGIGASAIMSRTLEWSMPVSPQTIIVATVFSTVAGLVFGYYPARQAARLDPIEALRFE